MKKKQNFQGQDAYKRFINNKRITRKEAMLAKCYECMSGYESGKRDCMGKTCPLYLYYPYKN